MVLYHYNMADSQKLILIIDDDPDFREIMATKLKSSGFKVEQASDGMSGLEIVKKIKPDLVLLDVRMPRMSGVQTLAKIKSNPDISGLKVIFLTNLGEIEQEDAWVDDRFAKDAGALGHIRKTYSKAQMPIVAMFNLADPKNIEQSLKLGANYYIVKAHVNTEEIVSKVTEILKSKNKEIPIEKIPETSESEIGEIPQAPKTEKVKVEIPIEAPKKTKEKIDKMLTLPEGEIPIIGLVDNMMES